jgi:hypothetical protein
MSPLTVGRLCSGKVDDQLLRLDSTRATWVSMKSSIGATGLRCSRTDITISASMSAAGTRRTDPRCQPCPEAAVLHHPDSATEELVENRSRASHASPLAAAALWWVGGGDEVEREGHAPRIVR